MQYWAIVVACGLALLVGALVQGLIGLGMALVATPVITLVDPSLVPGTVVAISLVVPVLTLIDQHDDVDWKGLAWAFPALLAGTALGAWLVVIASADLLSVLVGATVLVAVALSLIRWKPAPTPTSLSVGAFVSGVSGTATSVSGPPMALVYQHSRVSVLRCTLAVYFLIGGAISLAGLAIGGSLSGRQLVTAAWLVPFVLVGFVASLPIRRRVDADRVRVGVLLVSALSSVVLIVRALA